jgi:hypothetical protein
VHPQGDAISGPPVCPLSAFVQVASACQIRNTVNNAAKIAKKFANNNNIKIL